MNNKLVVSLLSILGPIFLITQLTVISGNASATSIRDLINAKQLTITSRIEQKTEQIVGQAIILSIEIATSRWFAKGTRVLNFKHTDLIMLPGSEVSINGTKKIEGMTWSTQTKELTLYPTKAGDYQISDITIDISVNTENHGIVEGSMTTSIPSFTISLPEELSDIEHFVVSPSFTLKVANNFAQNDANQGTDNQYAIGEAITQTVTFTVIGSPAMMIPPMSVANINGISIYQKTAQVFDKANRGNLTGTRIESFTYIFEQPGKFQIEQQTFYWWDLTTNSLKLLKIAGYQGQVGGSGNKLKLDDVINRRIISFDLVIVLLVCLAIISLGYGLINKRTFILAGYARLTHQAQRRLKRQFLVAIKQEQYQLATQLLFNYYQLPNKEFNVCRELFAQYPAQLAILVVLNQRAFAQPTPSNAKDRTKISIQAAKSLLNLSKSHRKSSEKSHKILLN